MQTEQILLLVGGAVAGLITKIIFDWFKGNRRANGNKEFRDCLKELRDFLEEVIGEIGEIKKDVVWMKNIHNNVDPITNQPRWYFTADMKKQMDNIEEMVKKVKEIQFRKWIKDGGTDPNIEV